MVLSFKGGQVDVDLDAGANLEGADAFCDAGCLPLLVEGKQLPGLWSVGGGGV